MNLPSSLSPRPLLLGIALGALALLPASALAGRVEIVSVTASSTYPAEGGVSYDADKVADGKVSTSWVEGDEGSGLGSWVELNLGGDKDVTSVKVWAGMWYSTDFWSRANRPKQLELEFSDGSQESCMLDNTQAAQVCNFKKKRTSKIKVRIKQVHSGTTWLDTGISEIQVFDAGADGRAPIKGMRASSVLPADGDGAYDPDLVGDGILDTMWCEGSKDGDGTGEWLEFQFDGAHAISSLSLINGVGGSLPQWMKANRAKAATLTFSDGSTQKVDIKNSFKLEKISFPSRSTSSVRLTFDEVVKGKEFNDLCISEAYFAP